MRPIFAALSLSLLAACHAPLPKPAAPTVDEPEKERVEVALPHDASGETAATDGRQPGDYCTLRFSGSYREAPVELTQRVAERNGDRLLIDIEMGGAPRLRLEIDDRPAHRGDVLSVWLHDDGGLVVADMEAYEELMTEVMLTADVNEGLVEEKKVELTLGDEAAEATKSTFRVRIGEQVATMSTFAILRRDGGRDWAWGDAGGEIKGAGGELLFRAEVVALGHDGHGAMAATEEEDAVEGLDAFDE